MKSHIVSLVVAAFAGYLGGVLSTQVLRPETAVAQYLEREPNIEFSGTKRVAVSDLLFWPGSVGSVPNVERVPSLHPASRASGKLGIELRGSEPEVSDISSLPSSTTLGQSDVSVGDLRAIIRQQRFILDKLDELAGLHGTSK